MPQFQKILIFCLLFQLLLLSKAALAKEESVPEVVKQSSDAVVQIVISDAAGEDTALGSGFLISPDGQIVTNYHVIKEAHSAIVKLANGAFFTVDGVLAKDADKDLAILKVNGKNLPYLTLASIENVHVGDHVVAIGSPLGLEGTVSDGIVSAFRDESGKTWIQTTAPVSHGNSGGPLLDLNNYVVGVVTWGVNLQVGQNLNFAAPCNEVKSLLTSVHQQPIPLEIAEKSDGTNTSGVLTSATTLWTSMTTGRDFKIRHENDYLYTEWANIPAQIQSAGGFMRTEWKKDSNGKWRGQGHSLLPCQYQNIMTGQFIVKWCSLAYDSEIDLLSEKRIEGIGQRWEKFDCRKCEGKGLKQEPFSWIPKQ